jgi:hypothetical protein
MSVVERLRNWVEHFVTAWRAVPLGVFWRGYWETPARWHQNWFTVFYFIPAVPGCFALWLYPNAITPLPTLEQATVYEGTASIWMHPSRGIGTINLKLSSGRLARFGCRYGAVLESACLTPAVLANRKKYEGKPARVWGAAVPPGFTSPGHVAVQIEIDGAMVRTYDWSVKHFNGGGVDSNENIVALSRIFAIYIVWVLLGFPYLNYRHWLIAQQTNESSSGD